MRLAVLANKRDSGSYIHINMGEAHILTVVRQLSREVAIRGK
ncbi:hypothetical protein ES707_07379 [subsurface metagenome]